MYVSHFYEKYKSLFALFGSMLYFYSSSDFCFVDFSLKCWV